MIQKDIRRIVNNFEPVKSVVGVVGTTTIYQYPSLTLSKVEVGGGVYYTGIFKGVKMANKDAKCLFKEVENA